MLDAPTRQITLDRALASPEAGQTFVLYTSRYLLSSDDPGYCLLHLARKQSCATCSIRSIWRWGQ